MSTHFQGSCDSSQRRVTVSGRKAINSETRDSQNLTALSSPPSPTLLDPPLPALPRIQQKAPQQEQTKFLFHEAISKLKPRGADAFPKASEVVRLVKRDRIWESESNLNSRLPW